MEAAVLGLVDEEGGEGHHEEEEDREDETLRTGGEGAAVLRERVVVHRGVEAEENEEASPQIIFVGLDMTSIEQAQRADLWHSVIMGLILLLVGFAGIIFLFMAQGYRATKMSLSRIQAFSDNLVENMPIGLVALDGENKIASIIGM